MMKKVLLIMVFLCLNFLVVACSNDTENSDSSHDAETGIVESETEKSSNSISGTNDSANEQQDSEPQEESNSSQEGEISQADRKIIYTAFLHIEVKEYQQTEKDIQNQAADSGGYVVDSNMHVDSESGSTNGEITVRIPQGQFRDFIQMVEDGSRTVVESSISGEDVTEEYVDLESRLKSKRVVEDRLLSFMEQAEKTEDLLTISNDLATVQEEIEQITGRMNYLQNKADLATVTIHIQENNVTISGINDGDLNTWEKTKQQFLISINLLLSTFSGIFVFIIGNLPVLILLGIIGVFAYLIIRKRKKNRE